MKLSAVLSVALVALAASGVEAQGKPPERSRERKPEPKLEIPANMIPPPGMCRVWLDDVPAAQQPAPTDCATAIRNRTAKGRVIYGDDYARKGERRNDTSKAKPKKKPNPAIKGFAPLRRRP